MQPAALPYHCQLAGCEALNQPVYVGIDWPSPPCPRCHGPTAAVRIMSSPAIAVSGSGAVGPSRAAVDFLQDATLAPFTATQEVLLAQRDHPMRLWTLQLRGAMAGAITLGDVLQVPTLNPPKAAAGSQPPDVSLSGITQGVYEVVPSSRLTKPSPVARIHLLGLTTLAHAGDRFGTALGSTTSPSLSPR